MSAIITNGRAFPGTRINVSNNIVNIGLGTFNSMVTTGFVTSVLIGGWNKLIAGSSTEIQLGTKMNATIANSVSVSFGDSWHYVDSNQTMHDQELRWAINQLEICSGVDQSVYSSNHNKQIGIVLAIVSMFAFTLGMSILATLLPPFKIGNNGKDDSSSAKELSSNGIYVLIGESFAILSVILAQFILARKMAEDNRSAPYLSRLSLAAKGMTMCLYNNAYSLPSLVTADDPDNLHKVDYYQFDSRHPNSVDNNTGYSMFGMLPGEPDEDSNARNWRNPKHGDYVHNNMPIISLNKHTLIEKSEYNTLLDMSPSSIFIAADNDKFSSSLAINKKLTTLQCIEKESKTGGAIIMDDGNTRIIRNTGKSIQILNDNFLSDYILDSDNIYHPVYDTSGLILSDSTASLFSSACQTGVFISGEKDDCSVDILTNGATLASFTDSYIDLCGTLITPKSTQITEDLIIKQSVSSLETHFVSCCKPTYNELFKKIVAANLDRMNIAKAHISAMHGTIIENLEEAFSQEEDLSQKEDSEEALSHLSPKDIELLKANPFAKVAGLGFNLYHDNSSRMTPEERKKWEKQNQRRVGETIPHTDKEAKRLDKKQQRRKKIQKEEIDKSRKQALKKVQTPTDSTIDTNTPLVFQPWFTWSHNTTKQTTNY